MLSLKEQATQALEESQNMDKTMENIRAYTSKHLGRIAFHWYQTYGTPLEEFQAMLKAKNSTLLDDTKFVLSFYQRALQ